MELSAKIPVSTIRKIELYQNTGKLSMAKIQAKTGANYIINGGIYSFSTFKPFGNVKVSGKVVNAPGYGEYGFAWDTGSDISYEKLPSTKSNYLGCVGMVLNGVKQKLSYNSDMGGSRQRSAIGLSDGTLYLYVCNGTNAKTPEKLQEYAVKQGWKNALMLDGGGSTQAIFNGQTLKSTENSGIGRIVQNYILVYINSSASTTTSSQSSTCPYKEPTVSIKSGSTGEGAKWVQWYLNKKASAGLTVDGSFGAKSVTALKKFQKSAGLTADGVCGAATRTALKK